MFTYLPAGFCPFACFWTLPSCLFTCCSCPNVRRRPLSALTLDKNASAKLFLGVSDLCEHTGDSFQFLILHLNTFNIFFQSIKEKETKCVVLPLVLKPLRTYISPILKLSCSMVNVFALPVECWTHQNTHRSETDRHLFCEMITTIKVWILWQPVLDMSVHHLQRASC